MRSHCRRGLIFLLAGSAALPLMGQAEQSVRIPSFLSNLPPQRLNSKPVQRFLHMWTLRSPDGQTIPDPAGARTLSRIQAVGSAPAPGLTYVLNTRWSSIGSQPIQNGQIGNVLTTRNMAGRIGAITVHPTNNNRWLVGTVNGGVWETRDAGATFVALSDAQPTLAIGALSYAPGNGNIVYAGTGEATFSAVSYGGEGILKSVDGGLNWTQIATATFVKGTAFADLKVDPSNANILVAATAFGFFGRPAVFPPGSAIGLWRSTDGGNTWTNTVTAQSGTSLSVNPSNFAQQYAGLNNAVSNSLVDAIKRSTNGGQTWANVPGPWTSIAGNADRSEVAISPSNPNRVYVGVTNRATGGMHGLWTTANAWDPNPTWVAISLAPTDNGSGTLGPCGFDKAFNSASGQCWYDIEFTVKPTDENVFFFGGIPLWRYNLGTNTWVEVSQTAAPANRNNGIHVDQHASAWAGAKLIFGNDGGVWSTTDDGGTWAEHNSTLSVTQYYEGSVSPDGSLQAGGSQDNGTHVRNGSNAWPLVFGGDGAGNALSTNTNWAVSSQVQGIARTTNGGVNFTSVRGNYAGAAPFIGKVRECPAAPGTVALNGSRFNVTTNFFGGPAATLWTQSGSAIFPSAFAGTAIAYGNTCTVLAMGSPLGELRVTPASGAILTAGLRDPDAGNQVPNRPVSVIAFPSASNTAMYVGLSGFANSTPSNIYRTADFTVAVPAWTNIGLPVDGPVNALAIDPADNNKLYAGTDYGVWYSANGGTNWSHMGPGIGMPNVPVFDLVIRQGKIYAFTHGRGAFVLSNFDINNDTLVNCADVAIVRAAMGKRIGQAGFNALADLNSDNAVNVRDLSMLTRQLPAGTSCP